MNFLPIYAFHPSFQLPLSRAIVWQASSIHRAAVFVYIQLTAHSQYSAANPKCLTLETIFSFRHGPKLLLFVAFELTERVPTVLLAGLLDGAISRLYSRQCFCNQIEFQSYVRTVASLYNLLQENLVQQLYNWCQNGITQKQYELGRGAFGRTVTMISYYMYYIKILLCEVLIISSKTLKNIV